MALKNGSRISPQVDIEGEDHLRFAMSLAALQLSEGRSFIFEHPASASSWRHPVVMDIISHPHCFISTFDMCRYGLVSKSLRMPQKKRTRLLSNLSSVRELFDQVNCKCVHEHMQIQGNEGGEKRSSWAQRYPLRFCEAIYQAAVPVMNGL